MVAYSNALHENECDIIIIILLCLCRTYLPGTNNEYAFATVFIEEQDSMIRITTDNPDEAFAAYLYTVIDGWSWGTKAYSAGYGQ